MGDKKTPQNDLVDLFINAPVGMVYEFIDLYQDSVKRGKSQIAINKAITKNLSNQVHEYKGELSSRIIRDASKFLRSIADELDNFSQTSQDDENNKSSDETKNKKESQPISDYDDLTVSEVIEKIKNFSNTQLDEFLKFEKEHKNRKSVISEISVLKKKNKA